MSGKPPSEASRQLSQFERAPNERASIQDCCLSSGLQMLRQESFASCVTHKISLVQISESKKAELSTSLWVGDLRAGFSCRDAPCR